MYTTSYTISYTYDVIYEMCAIISYMIFYYEIANIFHMKYINKSYMILYTCDMIYDFIYIKYHIS